MFGLRRLTWSAQVSGVEPATESRAETAREPVPRGASGFYALQTAGCMDFVTDELVSSLTVVDIFSRAS